MGSKICMNEGCCAKSSSEWKKGWTLKSGENATLCYNCGSAYENLMFCETFHLEETGWRECRMCGKRIHCGCIASKFFHECLDFGGVACTSCLKHLNSNLKASAVQIPSCEAPNGTASEDLSPLIMKYDKTNFLPMPNTTDLKETVQLLTSQKDETHTSPRFMSGDATVLGEANSDFPNFPQRSSGSSMFIKTADHNRKKEGVKDVYEALPSLNFFLNTSGSKLPFADEVVEGSEQNKPSSSQQGQKARHILPKTSKAGSGSGSEVSKGSASQARVARPPADGKGRSQLLPRYWPRITDEELQKLSEDLKSNIVPLFEKVLSASDAGRIGRLVLPKACAEAYFPTINQSDGLPIRIQDVKGKEWTFQFRFWPNNNSRMYVLEGVTPCIQNLQLQAGDTVTFFRTEPGGQLVIGFRKGTNNGDPLEPQDHAIPNGVSSGEAPILGVNGNIVQNGYQTNEYSFLPTLTPEKKKARNIGSKNKRLHMHSDDAMELRLTWEEAQELFRPPPTANPAVVMIEDQEFEEYDEPPIFGKKTVFTAHPSGYQAQWAQCDICRKWRKLPMDVLLPPRWTCSDNVWDANRCSCSAPDETLPWDLDPFNKASKDFKRRRAAENKMVEKCEPSGLDALASIAVLGDNITELAEPSGGTTTKHPRHRAGCSCIVCIQPPSGKGKHPPSCKCSVCNTVRRRFKTLMLRKKRKQSEREAELAAQNGQQAPKGAAEKETSPENVLLQMNHSNGERSQNGDLTDVPESSKGHLDLNSQPSREDDMLAEAAAGLNITSLINAASLPLDMYLRQNGLHRPSNGVLSNDQENELPPASETEAQAQAQAAIEKKMDEE